MRQMRIAALQGPIEKITPPVTEAKNLEWTEKMIRDISQFHVDVVALPEIFSTVNCQGKAGELAEAVPGPTTERMMKLAMELHIAIICPLYERRNGKIFNTAVMIDKSGLIVGQYDKIHPTEGEIDDGVMPGRKEPTVIELDGVKVGCQICFDANWPEDWLQLKRAGAQLIFFCSAFSAGTLLGGLATVLAVPVVASTLCRACRIYDRTGRMIAHQSPYFDFVMADVLIDQPLFHLDDQWPNLGKIRREHPEIMTEIFDGDGRWTIKGGVSPEHLQAVIDQYELMDVDQYLARAQRRQDQARK